MNSNYKFTQISLKSGYLLEEVISALIKCLRNGDELSAYYWAHELMENGYWKYLWRRLVIFASEDVGNANPEAAVLISSLTLAVVWMKKHSKHESGDVQVGQAILYLCRSEKTREADHFIIVVEQEKKDGLKLDIPDEALDKHTSRGRSNGRGYEHFFKQSGHLSKDIKKDIYKEDAIRLLLKSEEKQKSKNN